MEEQFKAPAALLKFLPMHSLMQGHHGPHTAVYPIQEPININSLSSILRTVSVKQRTYFSAALQPKGNGLSYRPQPCAVNLMTWFIMNDIISRKSNLLLKISTTVLNPHPHLGRGMVNYVSGYEHNPAGRTAAKSYVTQSESTCFSFFLRKYA